MKGENDLNIFVLLFPLLNTVDNKASRYILKVLANATELSYISPYILVKTNQERFNKSSLRTKPITENDFLSLYIEF